MAKVIEKKTVKITCQICKKSFTNMKQFDAHKVAGGGQCG